MSSVVPSTTLIPYQKEIWHNGKETTFPPAIIAQKHIHEKLSDLLLTLLSFNISSTSSVSLNWLHLLESLIASRQTIFQPTY